jgi:LysR family transcriptional regulator, glycine cleavage system transcriptional activator
MSARMRKGAAVTAASRGAPRSANSAKNPAAAIDSRAPNAAGTYDLPPLVLLRAFEAAARHQSFTAAAKELNLTQAAVSHQVRSLEKYLGVVLFERLARTLRLTEIGSAYLPPLRRSFDDMAAATAGLFGPVGRRTLVVRAPVSFVCLWLAQRVTRFTDAYPSIALRITSSVWAHSPADLAADVDIRFGDGIWPGFHAELVGNFPAIPVCRPDLCPSGNPAERLQALAKSPLIHVTGYEDLWQRLFKPAGIAVPAYAGLNIDTTIGALEMAASGVGATMVQTCFAAPYIADGRLTKALDVELPLEASHYILTAEGSKRKQPEAILFRNWLRSEAAASGSA